MTAERHRMNGAVRYSFLGLAYAVCWGTFVVPATAADGATAEKIAFFETKIRPVLAEACYECHNSRGKAEGNLVLDYRDGMLKGGDRGALIVPGKGEAGLLVRALRHADEDLRMPKGGAKVKAAVVADFVRWINDGAVDPRDKPPSAEDLARETSWERTRELRRQWWSFQPIRVVEPPAVADVRWNKHPVDRFLRARQLAEAATPAAPADPAVLIRRAALLLTGVPPTEEETRAFLADTSPAAYERAVDRLLASPRFGERWARHWMDWFRFAESHGSEGDPAVPHAYKYRDYLIRALNEDVPYNRLVQEHLAGDLMPQPRINAADQTRESALGIGHLRMVQHGFAPTDALDEQVRFIDNQIDVLTKAFLGLTVACARCHHHKFDPVSQQDFYALYGVLASCRPGTISIDTPERAATKKAELTEFKAKIRTELAAAWETAAESFAERLTRLDQAALDEAAKENRHPLKAWASLKNAAPDALAAEWKKLAAQQGAEEQSAQALAAFKYPVHWKLAGDDYARWPRAGNGLPSRPTPAGEFSLAAAGEQVVGNIFPAGVVSHGLSTKHNAVLSSPRFVINCDELLVRVAGAKSARVRYVVQNYPRTGLNYPHPAIDSEGAKWFRFDVRYWKGEHAHIEIATGDDQPVDVGSDQGRSWIAAWEVIGRNPDQPNPVDPAAGLMSVLNAESRAAPPKTPEELAGRYAAAVKDCVRAWKENRQTDAQAEFLGFLVRKQLLPNVVAQLPRVAPLLAEYRKAEAEVPLPIRAPGVHEGEAFDQPLFDRGDHDKPLAAVPRRFLEVFDAQPFKTSDSGRLELAAKFSDPANPLVARVIVNRVWHHLFGRGLVATTDNFGRLGEEPTHPELLDYLAGQFSATSAGDRPITPWSLKSLIRFVVLSEAFRQGNTVDAATVGKDPINVLLTRFPVRRLEGEAIRDSLIAVSVGLDEVRGGPSVGGNGRRRSVYVRVQRNSLDPFLAVFDTPEPSNTWGRRSSTNVPAQSLTMLNDPFVIDLAKGWAARILTDKTLKTEEERVQRMMFAAAGREPTADEVQRASVFMNASAEERTQIDRQLSLMQSEVGARRKQVTAILEPVRTRLSAERGVKPAAADAPQPIARWTFDKDLRDSIGTLHAELQGAARDKAEQAVESGALVVNSRQFAATPPLDRPLIAKTLEAWVRLDNLDQRGGGVISLESPDGNVFDAVVFGEQEPRRWMAGSDGFSRTKPVGGEAETEATERPVHLAAVYAADGTITLYRDGRPYGQGYQSSGPLKHAAGKSRVIFGLRHSPVGGNKHLAGRVFEARLYDRALSAAEVAASAASTGDYVSTAQILAELSAADRARVDALEAEIAKFEAQSKQFALPEWQSDPNRKWQDLAQSLFSWKEFLYVR